MLIDPEVLDRVIDHALRNGGEFAEVFAEDRTSMSAVLDDRKVEELVTGTSRGAGVRVISGETTGYAHTADLSESGLMKAAEVASAASRNGSEQGHIRQVALEEAVASNPSIVHVDPSEVAKSRKIDLLARADDAARAGRDPITQVSASYGESKRAILVASSGGRLVEDDQVRTRFSVSCIALGDGGMQTGYETAARTTGFELFDDVEVEDLAAKAATRAVTKLSARPAPSGELTVVLASGGGGVLFHEACGHGLEADHIAKDSSVYVGKVGEQVAGSLVTLVDDGTLGGEWGSYGIDDEGNLPGRNVLIENGVLGDYMWDVERGRKAGRNSSGNGRRQSYRHLPMVRMTNTFILPGQDDPDEIVAQTPYGIFVAQLGGGQVNITTGDFVFGMTEAYLIEDGKITAPLRDANLIGNGPEVLMRIDAVANDFGVMPGTCGKDGQSVPVGCGQPTLRIQGVTVGGTAG
ncbi:MAG: TldD/PmbA family protein [Actinobacteria bacterium]|nr:TldD/PmbA family protein [Actinomycetota bacterium]MCL5446777.1 TldD/PmbA family protein [Actinomycetota bacterium]